MIEKGGVGGMDGLRTRGMERLEGGQRQGRRVVDIGGKKKEIWEGMGGKEGGKLLRVYSAVL